MLFQLGKMITDALGPNIFGNICNYNRSIALFCTNLSRKIVQAILKSWRRSPA